MPVETYLSRKAQQGYLLHGSPRLFDVLEPHQAHSDSGDRSSNKKAVYAAGTIDKWYSEIPAQLSIAYAILDKSRMKPQSACSIRAGILGIGPVVMEITPDLAPAIGPGYVYVLPSNGFKTDTFSIQYYNKKPVKPLEAVPVSPEDYKGDLMLRLGPKKKVPYTPGPKQADAICISAFTR